MQLKNVTKPKQLLVEGRDAEAFFYPFIETLDIMDIDIQNYGGIKELPDFLGQLTKNSNFRSLVTSIGIVRDAEENNEGAYQSVQSALRNCSLPVPEKPNQPSRTTPKVSVFILPDANSTGMLETLLLRAVGADPVMSCVDEFLNCVEHKTAYSPTPPEKAKVLAFLASRKQIKPLIGHAALAGYWGFENPAYNELKEFILSL
jgi:hypothetical protein